MRPDRLGQYGWDLSGQAGHASAYARGQVKRRQGLDPHGLDHAVPPGVVTQAGSDCRRSRDGGLLLALLFEVVADYKRLSAVQAAGRAGQRRAFGRNILE